MPEDDVFFIVNVKSSDQGVYSCTATNDAGTIVANATVNVLGEDLNNCNALDLDCCDELSCEFANRKLAKTH